MHASKKDKISVMDFLCQRNAIDEPDHSAESAKMKYETHDNLKIDTKLPDLEIFQCSPPRRKWGSGYNMYVPQTQRKMQQQGIFEFESNVYDSKTSNAERFNFSSLANVPGEKKQFCVPVAETQQSKLGTPVESNSSQNIEFSPNPLNNQDPKLKATVSQKPDVAVTPSLKAVVKPSSKPDVGVKPRAKTDAEVNPSSKSDVAVKPSFKPDILVRSSPNVDVLVKPSQEMYSEQVTEGVRLAIERNIGILRYAGSYKIMHMMAYQYLSGHTSVKISGLYPWVNMIYLTR